MNEVTVIQPKSNILAINFKELYRYRELFRALAQRDFKTRYKQTVIGGLWAILQPFMTMIVFSFFFGKIAQIPSDGVPYPVFSYSGLLLWTFFSNCMSSSANSLLGNSGLISKVYFPRLLLPFVSTFVSFIDYLIAGTIVFGLMIYFHILPPITILFIPIIVFLTWMLACSIGLWLSALTVKFRDIRFIIPFFMQLLLFATPVIYPASVAGKFKWIVSLNPMTGLIEAHRALILGHQAINYGMIGISIIMIILIFITGLIYFRSVEHYFADII
jgi:lipopolysaccharide transport system permease protein